MKLPLIINENGDLSFYSSVSSMIADIEPIDVKNEEFELYDSEGNRYVLNVIIKKKKLLGLFNSSSEDIEISDKISGDFSKHLNNLIFNFLQKTGDLNKVNNQTSLGELIDICTQRIGCI